MRPVSVIMAGAIAAMIVLWPSAPQAYSCRSLAKDINELNRKLSARTGFIRRLETASAEEAAIREQIRASRCDLVQNSNRINCQSFYRRLEQAKAQVRQRQRQLSQRDRSQFNKLSEFYQRYRAEYARSCRGQSPQRNVQAPSDGGESARRVIGGILEGLIVMDAVRRGWDPMAEPFHRNRRAPQASPRQNCHVKPGTKQLHCGGR